MGKAPPRDIDVHFLGAGASMAFGLPSTAGLLKEIHQDGLATGSTTLRNELSGAYSALYPDGLLSDFIPNTVDFFSSLKAYIDIAGHIAVPSIPGAAALMHDLKRAIQQILINGQNDVEAKSKFGGSAYLKGVVKPGGVVITTNWDVMIERYAAAHGVPVAWKGSHDPHKLLLLKLHGSIDWCSASEKVSPARTSDFRTVANGATSAAFCRTTATQDHLTPGALGRVQALMKTPLMVAMYGGKGEELVQLSPIWRDAYRALAKAENLYIDGYSMPADDMEVRTLLRAGVERGKQRVAVTVRNPNAEVHMRIRHFVGGTEFASSYSPL